MAGRKPGSPKTGGRAAGTPNKGSNGLSLRDMTFNALERAGGEDYLHNIAETMPNLFIPFLGRFVPKDINANVESTSKIVYLEKGDERL